MVIKFFLDDSGAVYLENLLDRSEADIRGIKISDRVPNEATRHTADSYSDEYLQDRIKFQFNGRQNDPQLVPQSTDDSYRYAHSAHRPGSSDVNPGHVDRNIPGATIAGQANKKGGIFDRLSSPDTYTGVSFIADKFGGNNKDIGLC